MLSIDLSVIENRETLDTLKTQTKCIGGGGLTVKLGFHASTKSPILFLSRESEIPKSGVLSMLFV